jgi:hypothetical protein
MLEKSKPSLPNKNKKELNAVKSLRLNKGIRILQADKGICTDKLNTLLETRVYEPLPKDPTAKVESPETPLQTQNCSSHCSKTQTDSIPQQTSTSVWSA